MVTSTSTWTSSSNGDWNTGADWSPIGIPASNADALIDATGTDYIVSVATAEAVNITDVTVNSVNATLQVEGTLAASGTVIAGVGAILALNGGTVTVGAGGLTIGTSASATGSVTASGDSALLTVAAGIGDGSTGKGLLQAVNGGTIAVTGTKGITVGVSAGSAGTLVVAGTDSVTHTGALLSFASSAKGITVGSAGQGTLDVEAGGTVQMNGFGGLGIGQSSGATGIVEVSGIGAFINQGTAGTGMGIGQAGQGTLEVLNGGTVMITATGANNGIGVGQSITGSGLIVISGSNALLGLNTPNAGLSIGQSGHGTLDVQAAGTLLVNGKGLVIGTTTGGGGTVAVAGAGALIETLGTTNIVIGSPGTGLLSIGSGGTVISAAGVSVAQGGTTATGTVTVDGGTLSDTGGLAVGSEGTGVLTVQNSGTVSATGTVGAGTNIGQTKGSFGTVTVDHASMSETGGIFAVGGSGSGTLAVQNAGTVTTTQVFGPAADIGSSTGGTGVATVTGGSLWQVGGQFIVGDQGNGALSITAGGTVDAGSNAIDIGNQAGGSGTVVINGGNALLKGGTLNVDNAPSQAASAGLTIGSGGIVQVATANVAGGAVISLAGGLLDPAALSITTGGTVAGFGTLDAATSNFGTITASSGTLEVTGSVTGNGTIDIAGAAAFQADNVIGNTLSLTFAVSALPAELILGAPQAVNSFALTNWQNGDALVFNNGVTITGEQWLGGTLDVFTSGGTTAFTNVVLAAGTTPIFTHTANSVELISCFAAGTRILTARGEVPVEDLAEGDLAVTAICGRAVPIVWIGRRSVDCSGHPRPAAVWPVRISAGTFGPGRPRRDLWLSPDHAVYVEGVLIPIRHLINGTSVTQRARGTVTYYHIELPRHDVVLANGMLAESYLDAGARNAFANNGGIIQLHPDFAPPLDRFAEFWEMHGCAPLMIDGPEVAAARRHLAARAITLAA